MHIVGYIVGGIVCALIIWGIILDHGPSEEDKAQIQKVGRGALWTVAPPLGLWRSWKHGQKKRDDRIIDAINKSK